MTDYFADIPSEIIDMLQTDATLTDATTGVKGWIVGDHPNVPLARYPVCFVIPGEIDMGQTQQTGFIEYTMIGQLIFEVLIQDLLTFDSNNKATLASLTRVQSYMYRVRQVFKAEANVRLDAPTIAGDAYKITRVMLDEAQEIGAIERENNFYNRGEMLWAVRFMEART